ncbi:MAG: DUF47 domain-containing protein [Elusimicrobia bacterium]|nr:DUF47 domain-containing protein [Elusimicrobiota bacterium]
MAFSLIPREEKFFDLLEEAAANVYKVAVTFKGLVTKWDLDDPRIRQIRDLEHDGDSMAHDIFDRLNRTFVTPLDREDIHGLASDLDDILDLINSVTQRMHRYQIKEIRPELIEQADVLDQAVSALVKAVGQLRNMGNTRRILDYCIEVDRLENEGDRVLDHALSGLFVQEKNPIEIIKWKEIFEVAEAAIDNCEDVSNTIETIIVKHS